MRAAGVTYAYRTRGVDIFCIIYGRITGIINGNVGKSYWIDAVNAVYIGKNYKKKKLQKLRLKTGTRRISEQRVGVSGGLRATTGRVHPTKLSSATGFVWCSN